MVLVTLLSVWLFQQTLWHSDAHVLCLQETYSKPQDESIWQIDWEDKKQAVFNSNVHRKTDARTAILLNYPRLQFGNVKERSAGRILTADI